MTNHIQAKLNAFKSKLDNDKNHRFRSWEHCFEYFSKAASDIDEDRACLHLAFYLASWGMFRGSTFSLQKDYLFHMDVVKKILKVKEKFREYQYWDNELFNDDKEVKKFANIIAKLGDDLKKIYLKKLLRKKAKTATLVTKILGAGVD